MQYACHTTDYDEIHAPVDENWQKSLKIRGHLGKRFLPASRARDRVPAS